MDRIALFPPKNPSSQIKALGHDPVTESMVVTFHSGQRYSYDGVSSEEYLAVVNAESAGRAFNQTIRGKKEYRVIDRDDQDE